MAKYIMEMVLEYAKVFPENADMGDLDGNKAAVAVAKKGGQYVTNAYFTDAAQIGKLLEGGLDPHPMNSNRILEGRSEYGIGKFMKLKRPVPDNIKVFQNKGKEVEVNYGGEVGVVDLTNGPENRKLWSVEEDGFLGNGTKALVEFETYSQGAGVRVVNIGVTEHVPYEQSYEVDPRSEYFKVA